ncbi:hypothetical protein BCR42DRAFT_427190 [Absidia repens]|uniref:Uncharacterized protein n=1 Tax=Absidia repens TaxID=90262 RepID=A0A1X2I047_9FUNG|nr:hypothetical protein BCR42DRAFT_427190 [Absidia repens]
MSAILVPLAPTSLPTSSTVALPPSSLSVAPPHSPSAKDKKPLKIRRTAKRNRTEKQEKPLKKSLCLAPI